MDGYIAIVKSSHSQSQEDQPSQPETPTQKDQHSQEEVTEKTGPQQLQEDQLSQGQKNAQTHCEDRRSQYKVTVVSSTSRGNPAEVGLLFRLHPKGTLKWHEDKAKEKRQPPVKLNLHV